MGRVVFGVIAIFPPSFISILYTCLNISGFVDCIVAAVKCKVMEPKMITEADKEALKAACESDLKCTFAALKCGIFGANIIGEDAIGLLTAACHALPI